MSRGIVYILTNPCLDGWVKIGMTDRNDIDRRLHELNSPANIPLSFRAYATYEVENPYAVEQSIHKIIDIIDNSLHAREQLSSGRVREREFFQMSAEAAYAVLLEIAKLRGDTDALTLVAPTEEQQEEEEISEGRRAPFAFDMVDIPVGSELTYVNDSSIRCTVCSNKHVQYQGEEYSLTALAVKLLGWAPGTAVQGPKRFKYGNETLWDRRLRLETE